MKLALMRFKGFTLWCNPLSVEIQSEKNNIAYTLPYSGEIFEDIGLKCRVIKGKGVLKGENCIEQYASLRALQSEKGEGVLSLPGCLPMKAYFTELNALADITPDTISYSFVFTEASSKQTDLPLYKEHTVKDGETLYDIAAKYSVDVGVLVELNPSICRPDELKGGERIKLC